MTEKIVWMDVQNYEGRYKVSNYGEVKSVERVVVDSIGRTQTVPVRILKASPDGGGYLQVVLYRNGKGINHNIHRLVAEHFISNTDNTLEVNHKNGIKTDNRVENLEWVTHSENTQHAYDTGLQAKGEEHCNSKLSNSEIIEIYNLAWHSSLTQRQIASRFGIARSRVSYIKNGINWSHITKHV